MKLAQKLALAQKNSPKTTNKKKKSDSKKQKNKPGKVRKTHPTYARMISEALDTLVGSRKGVGYMAVIHYIEDTYPISRNFTRYVKIALHAGVESGIFQIAPIAKYRLSAQGRKVLRAPQRKKETINNQSDSNQRKETENSTQDDSTTKKMKKAPSSSPSSSPKVKSKKPKTVLKKEKNTKTTSLKKKSNSAVISPKEKSKYDYIWQYKENDASWGDYAMKASDELE